MTGADAGLKLEKLPPGTLPPGAVLVRKDVEAASPNGFAQGDVGVIRDNAGQLKFKADSKGVRRVE